jgi:hypothetical protein
MSVHFHSNRCTKAVRLVSVTGTTLQTSRRGLLLLQPVASTSARVAIA